MKIILFLFTFVGILNAYCYKLPCQSQIQQSKSQAINDVTQSYNKNIQAQNKLKEKYNKYNEALKEQNDLLKKIQKIKENNLLSEKEIFFLTQKILEIRSKNIDTGNEKAFLKKENK